MAQFNTTDANAEASTLAASISTVTSTIEDPLAPLTITPAALVVPTFDLPFHIIPHKSSESRFAGVRFYRLINDLVARCERISAATNCWLFVGAQHYNATSGVVSYASPRLRRDAKTELAALQDQFNAVVSALLTSSRVVAFKMGSATEEKPGGDAAEAARQQVETRDMIILAQQRIIADLRAAMDG